MILSDYTIKELGEKVVEPFVDHQVRKEGDLGVISYGTSSYGYDLRLGDNMKVLVDGALVDPHDAKEEAYRPVAPVEFNGRKAFFLSPHQSALVTTLEKVEVPDFALGFVQGKSTYMRCGLLVNTTPLEPGWRGHLTINLVNTSGAFVVLYIGEGIAQMYFVRGDRPCETSYDKRGGKYQDSSADPVISRI